MIWAPPVGPPPADGMILWIALVACNPADPEIKDTSVEDTDPLADHVLLQDGFFNVAHRGGRRLWPEHTLLAYGNAIDAGADVIECDAHASSDGVIVCMHDANLSRTTDGEGLLKDLSFDALRQLDAGYWFTEDGETYPHRGTGLQIPTLEEALTQFPETPITIEIKQVTPSIATVVGDLLDQNDAWDRAALMSFFDPPIVEIREREPSALTALTTLEGIDFMDADDDYEPPARHLHAPMDFGGIAVSTELVDQAHAHGIRVWMWTINNPDDMTALIAMGVDGIFTDDPVLLESLL